VKGLSLKRILCVLFVGSFLLAGPASAHVSVSSDDAEPGAEVAVVTFHVPTESASASTTKLAVQLPKFDTVTVLPMTGWTFTTKKSGQTITEVDWTAATDAAIKPGEFGDFTLRVGPLPKAGSVEFGAVQTYSDGSTVAWNESAAPGSDAEPDHPKPTLTMTTPAAAPKPASTTGATVLAIVALVVAALALGVAVVGNARRKAA
jgi:periplasmic copper chaperone A